MQTPDKDLENGIKLLRDKISVLQLFKGIYVELYPKVQPIAPIVKVSLHPSFITTISFPEGTEIIRAVASFKPKHFVYRNNVLEIQPSKDFLEGNAVVYYQDGKVVRHVQLFLKVVNQYGKNLIDRIYYPQVVLVDRKILSPVEVLETYRSRYGKYPDGNVFFRIDGISYRIEVNPQGNVRVGNRTYLVIPCKTES